MFTQVLKIIPWSLRRCLNQVLYKSIFKKGSPFAISLASLLHGIKLKQVREGIYLIKGYENEVLVPWEGWGFFIEILRDQVYEQVFRVEKGDVVLDVGAHVGIFTVKATKAVGKDGLVVAIEPEPMSMALLQENVRNQDLNNVVFVGEAAGSRKGRAKLYLSPRSGRHSITGAGTDYIKVDMDTLDNIASKLKLKKVDFIKIDVEGAELEVLRGAEKILNSPNVKLAIAAYHKLPDGKPEFPDILSYLKSRGMKIWTKNKIFIYAKT